MNPKSALLIVDVQLDFCPGGALPVPDSDKIIPVLNKYIKLFSRQQLPIFASRDWHSRQIKHFKQFGIASLFVGGLATDYCVKWTVMDALKFGYKVTLLLDAIKGVNIKPRDSEVAFDEMIGLGSQKTTFEKLYKAMADNSETFHKKGGKN